MALSLFVLAVLYFFDVQFYLDWIYWWYDMVLHFLGGVTVGLFALWGFEHFSDFNPQSKVRVLIWGVVLVLIVGVLWEWFELYVGFTMLDDGMEYVVDTISDLILDTLGAILTLVYGFKLKDE